MVMATATAMGNKMAKTKRTRSQTTAASPNRSKPVLLVLIIGTFFVVCASFLQAFAALSHKSNPVAVVQFFQNEPVANVRLADLKLATITAESDFGDETGVFARRSLRAQALNPGALRHFGILSMFEGDMNKADQVFAMAQRMSKRDHLTSIYRHEFANTLGRPQEAAEHLDNAARTSRTARTQLLPRAIEFLDEADTRIALGTQLAEDPDWAADFWSAASTDRSRSSELAMLRLEMPSGNTLVPDNISRAIIRNTLLDNEPELAVAVFRHAAGQDSANQTLDKNLDFTPGYWPPFTWQSFVVADATASAANDGVSLDFSVLPGAQRALLARRLINYPAGTYRLAFELEQAEDANLRAGQARISLLCADSGKSLGSVALEAEGRTAPLSTIFTIDQDCEYQWIRVESAPNPSQAIASGRISDLTINHISE